MKRWVSLLAVLYCLRSDGVYLSFDGMSQSSVDSMMAAQGFTCQYLTQSVYDTVISTTQVARVAANTAQQAALVPYQIELTTTIASMKGATTSYIAASAIGQLQINTKMVRINELRALLGIQ